jgi:hypothetical protein
VIAASRVTLVARKKEATGDFIVATFETGIREGRIIVTEWISIKQKRDGLFREEF